MISQLLSNLGFGIFQFGTIQFAVAFAAAFFIMLIFGRPFVSKMRSWQKKGQPIRADGPQSHLLKSGTPTMGGILIILAIVIASVLFMDWANPIGWIALAALVSFGGVGFADDYKKIRKQSSDQGLSAYGRLILEGIAVMALAFFANRFMPAYLPELSVNIPLFGIFGIGIFYFFFAYFVIVGAANAANITDGLDGMLSKVSLPVLLVLAAALFGATHIGFFSNGLFLSEAAALYPVLGAAFGAVLGFLWFNSAPAAIFMGDVGSLALGGFMGTVAVLLKAEIIFGIAAAMMVLILTSSFIQTVGFKLTRKLTGTGRRVFLMAPLHHHFELKGWAETKIVERFFVMSILFSAVALAILKA